MSGAYNRIAATFPYARIGTRIARGTASAAARAMPVTQRRSARNLKVEDEAVKIKEEPQAPLLRKTAKRIAASPTPDKRTKKRVKLEDSTPARAIPPLAGIKTAIKSDSPSPSPSPSPRKTKQAKSPADKAADLQAKKLKSYAQFANQSPFPEFPHPTPAECKLAHQILSSLHGARTRPAGRIAAPTKTAGCGSSPSVLDALVRTILSQNTSDKNSSRAKQSMDKVYGGSDKWDAIVAGGQAKLQTTIQSGGLSVVKSKVIISVLQQVKAKYGDYSLDHLFDASDEDAMREMLAFQGVGPKTASCVLLFCLQRESFAVDTHVHRITGLLGWRPKGCSREEAHAHLDARIPDEDKYGLHVLIIKHGKQCEECKAGGKSLGKCELRKAFREGKIGGEAGETCKTEEIEKIKEEESDVETDRDAVDRAIEQVS